MTVKRPKSKLTVLPEDDPVVESLSLEAAPQDETFPAWLTRVIYLYRKMTHRQPGAVRISYEEKELIYRMMEYNPGYYIGQEFSFRGIPVVVCENPYPRIIT